MLQTLSTGLFLKFIKFGIVGFSGLIVDFGLTWWSKEKLNLSKYLSNTIGFIVAATSNYYLNRLWTFASQDPEILLQYSKFFIVSLIGLGLNTLFLYGLHEHLKWNFYLAKLLAIGGVVIWNFTANYYFTF